MGSGKYKHIWKRSKDGANRGERSFIRYVIIATAIFLIFICFIKRDNVFRWIEAGFNIKKQDKQIEYYEADIERLQHELESLTNDRDTLEKYAREKFLFAEPGEDVYVEADGRP